MMTENMDRVLGPRIPTSELQTHWARYLLPT